jgi:putative sigma-54 modulation protein
VRTIVKGKNLDVPDHDRRYAEHKLARLARLLDDRTDAIVELSIEHRRSGDVSHIVEVTLMMNGRPVRGVAAAPNHRAAVDQVLDKLERRAVDHKERPRLRARPIEARTLLRSIADGTAEADRPSARVVKLKRFAIEPMFEEDAVAKMEELGHEFFIFVDAETERIAVLYRRRDGDYGLIEPQLGGTYRSGVGARNGPRPRR